MEQRKKMRRSVIATRDLPAGTILTLADLSAKRPGTGFPPEKINSLVGTVVIRDVKADTLISDADFSK
jgi:N-acetylneuraminate synthase